MILAMAAVSVLLIATQVCAETNAICCYCGKFFKLSDKGAGLARNYVGMCDDCKREIGDVDKYLDKMRGELRGLADAAKLTLDKLKQALDERDKARDGIYGIKGTAVGFFKSLMKFAADGTGGTFAKIAKYTDKGIDYYNHANDALNGDYQWTVEVGTDWLKDKTIDKVAIKGAAGLARASYEQTRDARGSTRILMDKVPQIKEGLTLLDDAHSFYEATDKLADGLQEYLEKRQDCERLAKEWDDITNQMDELITKITKLEHCKQGMNGGKGGGPKGDAGRTETSRLALGTSQLLFGLVEAGKPDVGVATEENRRMVKARMRDDTQPSVHDVQTALEGAKKIKTELKEFMTLVEAEVEPPLVGFWVGVEKDFGGALSLELLKWAGPNVKTAGKLFDQIISAGKSVAGALDETKGGALVGSKGYWLPDGNAAVEVVMMHEGAVWVKPPKEGGKPLLLTMKTVDEKKRAGMFKVRNGRELTAIGEGESKKLDLDGDGVEDVEVTVKKVSDLNGVVAEVKRVGG